MDILAYAGNPDLQAADPSHHKIDLHAAGRRVVKGRHDHRIAEGIHLTHNVGRNTLLRVLRLTSDHLQETVLHPDRRHDQAVPSLGLGISGKHVEYGGSVLAVTLVAGKDAAVRIELGCGIVIVSGCKMNIAADACLFSSHHKGNLTVSFKSHKSVDNVAACLFKHLRPYNVILLVKTRLQLNQDRNLFSILRRLGKGRYDRRVAADTVQCLFDGKDSGVFRRLADEIHHRVETHIWMMQENIAFPDHLEDIFVSLETGHRGGRIFFRLVLVEPVQSVHLHEHGQIQRTLDAEDILVLDSEFCLEDLQKTFVHLLFRFQTDHLAPLTLFQLLLDLHQKVFRLVLVNGEVRVSHNTVGMGADHVVAEKKLADIPLDDLLQKDYGPGAVFLRRDLDHSRQHGGNLHGGELQDFFSFFPVFLGDKGADIQRLVPDKRERSGRIHGHRRKNRIYVIFKIPVHKFFLFIGKLLMLGNHMEAGFLKSGQERTVIGAVLLPYQFMSLGADLPQLVFRGQPGDIRFLIAGVYLVFQGRHANHEKLVQIRSGDT